MIKNESHNSGERAGGATAARELKNNGFEVVILEAGPPFKPFSRRLSLAEPLRRLGLLGGEKNLKYLFPPMDLQRLIPRISADWGITTGGSTVLTCGNLDRADRGLEEICLDLTPEYGELGTK